MHFILFLIIILINYIILINIKWNSEIEYSSSYNQLDNILSIRRMEIYKIINETLER